VLDVLVEGRPGEPEKWLGTAIARQMSPDDDERMQAVLDHAPIVVTWFDVEGRLLFANREFERVRGVERGELLGRTLAEFLDPESAAVLQRNAREVLAAGAPMRFEESTADSDGVHNYLSVKFPLFDHDGAAYAVCSASFDITEAKRQAEELTASQHFVAVLADNMTEGMYALDGHGNLSYMNRAAEEILGWTQADLKGRSMHDAIHFVRRDASPHPAEESPVLGAMKTGEPVRVEDDAFIGRDGKFIPVAYSCSPLKGGEPGAVVVFRDITEIKSEQLRVARELEALTWVGRIREALDERRFVLYAQPIMEISSGAVTQHELLIRMVDRDGRVIEPNLFLPAAERFGLIEEIDQWVIGEAARLTAEDHAIALQFNLSGKSIGHARLGDRIRAALREHGGDPSRLICEITETALVENAALGEAFVRELTAVGCEVALDDFGTGYGGFTYLKRLPVTYLKIDMEFVRDLIDNSASRHVVAAVVSLARGFGQKTIAEGVENERTLKMLHEMGVDYAQGYGIARPAPVEDILKPRHRG
jgi:PAS domain S-box-containing protein